MTEYIYNYFKQNDYLTKSPKEKLDMHDKALLSYLNSSVLNKKNDATQLLAEHAFIFEQDNEFFMEIIKSIIFVMSDILEIPVYLGLDDNVRYYDYEIEYNSDIYNGEYLMFYINSNPDLVKICINLNIHKRAFIKSTKNMVNKGREMYVKKLKLS